MTEKNSSAKATHRFGRIQQQGTNSFRCFAIETRNSSSSQVSVKSNRNREIQQTLALKRAKSQGVAAADPLQLGTLLPARVDKKYDGKNATLSVMFAKSAGLSTDKRSKVTDLRWRLVGSTFSRICSRRLSLFSELPDRSD